MGKIFSKELQKYYKHQGNRLAFKNGMSLNKLALEMWERNEYSEVDSSMLSRVINGDRLFNFKQLQIFCESLHINGNQKLRLESALNTDLNDQFGIDSGINNLNDKLFVDSIWDTLERVKRIKLENIQFTKEWLDQISEQISHRINTAMSDSLRRKLLLLKAEILVEQLLCEQISKTKDTSWYKFFKLAYNLKKTGEDLHDQSFINMANFDIGNTFYITGNYDKAIYFLKKAIKTNYDSSDSGKNVGLRALGICFAYKGNKTEFNRIKGNLLLQIEDVHVDLKTSIAEGIARGDALLGNFSESLKSLELAKSFYSQVEKSNSTRVSVRRMQIDMMDLSLIKMSNSFKMTPELFKRAHEDLDLANKKGYLRLGNKINDLLSDGIVTNIKTGW